MFKPPGYKKWIRQKAHNWGVDTMNSIIEKDIKLKEQLIQKKEEVKQRAKSTTENIKMKKDLIKSKIKPDSKEQ